jgi:hypothetical protein
MSAPYRSWTKLQIINKIEADLDLQEETFITPAEMTLSLEQAIDDCEAVVHTMNKDYFLTKSTLNLVNGTSDYDLPANIYATKIRGIIYRNGTRVYPIRRLKSFEKFLQIAELAVGSTAITEYQYLLINDSNTAGFKIQLHPTSQETVSGAVTIWYLRNASRLVNDSDVCDIPEFINYIFAHVKKSCLAKENGGEAPPGAVADLDRQEKLMVETLKEMAPDGDDLIEKDLTFYEDHS